MGRAGGRSCSSRAFGFSGTKEMTPVFAVPSTHSLGGGVWGRVLGLRRRQAALLTQHPRSLSPSQIGSFLSVFSMNNAQAS